MTKIQVVAKTHVGRVRFHNEDSFIVGLDPISDEWVLSSDEVIIGKNGVVFIVADGMGGENAGEIASEIAIQAIKHYIGNELKKEFPSHIHKVLESALIFAHNRIKDACRDNADYIGMGTTASVCFLTHDRIYISWIGDTRVYRYSQHGRVHALPYHYNNLEILSEDHSKVWQMVKQGQLSPESARVHPESNIITQSLGDLFRTPYPESREYPLFKDDYILICSDGLNGMINDEALERILTSEYESFDKMADQMILEANLAGGHDNITLIMTKVMEGIPYSEDILKKGTGEKTLKTEVFSKANTINWKDILIAGFIALGLILAWQKRQEVYNYFGIMKPSVVTPPVFKPKDVLQEEVSTSINTPNEIIRPVNDKLLAPVFTPKAVTPSMIEPHTVKHAETKNPDNSNIKAETKDSSFLLKPDEEKKFNIEGPEMPKGENPIKEN